MARTKFLNADRDETLGGVNSSHEYIPSQKAVKVYVDNHATGMPAVAFTANSANESNITFSSTHSYQTVSVTGSTQTFNISVPSANTFVNYLLVTNTGSAACTIALAAASGMTWTSFVLPTDAIEVGAGKSIELSFISINNHTQLVVTKSAEMQTSTLP